MTTAGAAAGDGPAVDSHLHTWPRDARPVPGAWHANDVDASADRLMATLDAHGVEFAVVAAASLFGADNSYVRAAVKREPRLRATAILDPATTAAELEALKADGFIGIRLVWAHYDEDPDIRSPEYRAFLGRVADIGWSVHFIDRQERTGHLIAELENAGVTRIVVDHFGHFERGGPHHPEAFRAVLAAVERGRTWVKLSGGFRFHPPALSDEFARQLLDVNGGERLLWGSDWPFVGMSEPISYEGALDLFRRWVPDARARQKIGRDTPIDLFFS